MRARNILNLTLISGCLLLAGVSLSLMSPFYPTEALTKGVTVTQSGFVIGSVFISTILFTPICGKYIELLGARNFLLVGSFIVAIGNIAFGFLSEINNSKVFFWSSILIRVIIAIGESAMTPACYALASQQLGERHQGKAISLAEACFGVGTMFGPSIGGFLYQIGGFSLPFWIAGGVLFLINMSAIICLEDKSDMYTRLEEEEGITWKQVLCAPGVGVSLFGLAFAGSAWSWYSATLEPFLDSAYGLDPAQTGLVFTAFGATYTLFTPMFGFLADKGMNGISALILGNSIIGVGLLFLGPIPPFFGISGNLWLSVLSIGVQGLGSAATYLGSLLIMMKGVKDAGLPDTEQVKTMVSSLWIVADCAGGYAGSTLGSIAYDNVGFEYGTLIEAGALVFTVLVMGSLAFSGYTTCRKPSTETQEKEKSEKRRLIQEYEKNGRTYGS